MTPATPEGSDEVPILVVDDREADLLAIAEILTGPGYRLVTARTADDALRRILAEDFAVILLDVVMPVIDGFELATLIRKRERSEHTPVIFLTAAPAELSFLHRAYSVGAVDYLGKPIDPAVVRAKVGVFVELFRKDRRIRQQAAALLEADRRAKALEIERVQLEGERRYRNLAEAVPLIVWTATPDGELCYGNQRWCEYTGVGVEGLRDWRSLVHPDDLGRHDKQWRRSVATGTVHEGQLRIRRWDGVHRWHICRAVPDRGTHGQIVGWVGTFTDCDDLKRAVQYREEFLAIASHELRTPITTLRLQLASLQRTMGEAPARDGGDGRARKIDMAVRQTDRLHRLIERLLDVSRIAAARLDLEPEEVDLAKLAREVAERHAEEATAAGCSLQLEGISPAVGRWDRLRLEQVLTNLLSNAIRYAPGAPIVVTVTQSAESATLTVSDHGSGIAPEHLDTIFSRFERAEADRRAGSLGMGLYISREIVKAHGGVITVTSEPGAGATFSVTLPRREPEAERSRPSQRLPDSARYLE